MEEVDYLIIGQGLAGSLLACTLLQNQKKFLIIDNHFKHNASLIGAGMFCPVSGKRMTKSWMIDELLPRAVKMYQYIEDLLQKKFIHFAPIYQVFGSVKEQNDLMGKLADSSFARYIDPEPVEQPYLHQPYGAFGIKYGGWIDTRLMITSLRTYFESNGLLLNDFFDYNYLSITDQYITYKNIKAAKVVFCEGVQYAVNPYFSNLPYKLCKGEILTIKANFDTEVILKKGIYLIRTEPFVYRVGSTYNWNDLTSEPSKDGYEFLKQKISELIGNEFEILKHEAGVRPTIIDRKPVLGRHESFKQLYLLNGLGTKGILNAPYFANMMFEFAEFNKPLLPDVDLYRFKNRKEKSNKQLNKTV